MKTNTLKAGRVDATLHTSVRRTDALRRAAPAIEGLAEVDRRIEILTGYMGQSHDHALRLIDFALKTRI